MITIKAAKYLPSIKADLIPSIETSSSSSKGAKLNSVKLHVLLEMLHRSIVETIDADSFSSSDGPGFSTGSEAQFSASVVKVRICEG